MEFRLLRADEIDCRISMVNQYGVGLLLYKDARCDMNILDETVGKMNWQRSHSRDNANCTVSIWDAEKAQWISKEDTGTESFTERGKGLASDSFKRACFNWGIGRELYTAPDMFVSPKSLKKFGQDDYKKWYCKDRFIVKEIEYKDRSIVRVLIFDETSKEYITFGALAEEIQKTEEVNTTPIGETKAKVLEARCDREGVDYAKVCALLKVSRFEDITEYNHSILINGWNKWKERCKKAE